MYITNEEIIRCLFDDDNNKIHHIIMASNDFGTYCNAFNDKGDIIKSLHDINITIDNNDFKISIYDDDFNIKSVCDIPLMWLIRNSTYPINQVI